MLDDNEAQRFSDDSEAVVKKQFEKLRYAVKKLDRPTGNARPDFLISDSSGPRMLCEVKAILSFGYIAD
jgi:DNA-binding sugar fermentation-stimulating protein